MIYIKTDMKEIPKGCLGCREVRTNDFRGYYLCNETGRNVKTHLKARPDWCPLVELKEESK